MRKLLPFFLALLLLFTACGEKEPAAFSLDEDGYGCTDTETGIHYAALPLSFEPILTETVRGVYTDRAYTRTYYEIVDTDPRRYIGDNEGGVWYAGKEPIPAPEALTPTAVILFEEQAVSIETRRFSAGKDDGAIAEILSLWFEGEAVDGPEASYSFSRRVKMQSAELPNIYYCFEYRVFGESAYFCDVFSGRTVAVPASLAEKFY